MRASKIVLDLRAMSQVVRKGALVPRGMPQFEEYTENDVLAIQHFVRSKARLELNAAKVE